MDTTKHHKRPVDLGVDCELCGLIALVEWQGSESLCLRCAESCMAHGHDHVHDYASDCVAYVSRLDGQKVYTIRCPDPMPPEGDLEWSV